MKASHPEEASEDSPCILESEASLLCCHNSLSLVPLLRQTKPFCAFPSYCFKSILTFYLPSMHTCSKWSIQVYPPKLPHTAIFSYGATYCAHLILFGVYVLNCTNNEPHYYALLSSLLLLLPPTFQIFSLHLLLKHRWSMFPPQYDRSSFTPSQKNRQNLVSYIWIHMILDSRWEGKRYRI